MAATFLAIAVLASFELPVAGSFKVLPGGREPGPSMPDRCVELSYRGVETRWLPASLRLTSDVAYADAPGGRLYRADAEHGSQWEWRIAGPDSIDVAHHHSLMIRLPARGGRTSGRVGAQGYWTLWEALFAHPDGQAFAREIACLPS